MHRKLIISVIGSIVVAVGLLGANILLGYQPALGLDLRGGISVTLRPVPGQDYDANALGLAVERIRDRVDSLGVGEPEIIRQDDAIVVNLPGVNDQQQALDLVNVTGKVYLRPVVGCLGPPDPDATTTTTTVAGASTTTDAAATTTTPASTPSSSPSDSSIATPARRLPASTPSSDAPTTTTAPSATTDGGSTTTVADGSSTTVSGATSTTAVDGTTTTTSPPILSDPNSQEQLPTRDGGVCLVNPAGGTGEVFVKDSAEAQIINGRWGVTVGLKGGASGEDIWAQLAQECFSRGDQCPSGQLAIELDGLIQSAPTVQTNDFGDSVQITGQFSKSEATKLSQVLNAGALPVTLQNEAIANVSATLGEDSLRAALVAGAIGILLVVLFMILYYGRLAVVVVAGLAVSGALIYSTSALISEFYNGVLSLSGVAGLVVSIGVTVDTYVVFFERLKDDVRLGRSLRNSARRGFKSAFRTVLIANAVSLIGALVLFYLSVGAVRGFAFYLALSTVMDVIVAYFFTGPAVLWLARTRFMNGSKILGLDAPPNTAGGAVAGAGASS